MMTLHKYYVRSQLEYCSLLWHTQSIDDIEAVEGVQRTFTSKIMGLSHINYWERLKTLNLMSLQRRRERYVIIMMWKIIINGVVPNDMKIEYHHNERLGIRASLPGMSTKSKNSV